MSIGLIYLVTCIFGKIGYVLSKIVIGIWFLGIIIYIVIGFIMFGEYPEDSSEWTSYKRSLKRFLCFMIPFSIIAILIPSKSDMLIASGLYAAGNSELVAKGGDTALKALEAINNELDKINEPKEK